MRLLFALLLLAAPVQAQTGAPAPASTPASTQDWRPDGTVTIVSPYAPGGGSDAFMRAIAEYWQRHLGQTVVIANRDGGSGVVGMRFVAGSSPDGRTLAMTPMTPVVVQPHMVRNLGMDPTSFAPVCGTNENVLGVVVRRDSPVRDLPGLVALGRTRPLTYGSAGPNSLPMLGVWRIQRATGVEFTHLAYRGDPPHLNELLGGRLDFSTTVVASASEHILSGTMRLLGVFSAGRHPDFPDVPTAREQGIDALQFSQVGIYAPRGTPEPVLNRLEQLCREAIQDPLAVRMAAQGRVVVRYMNRADFTAMISQEFENYRGILRELGVQPE